jgi:hypothetical protein
MLDDPKRVFEETYVENITDPVKWGQNLVDQYNRDIPVRGGEPRKFLGAEIISDIKEHEWEKTNLFTIMRGKRVYDTYKCKRCGITAKVFGLNTTKVRDAKYKAKKYDVCNK